MSSSATGLSYANNSGVFTLTAGYAIPTSVKLGQYDTAYNRSIVSAAVSGTGTKTLSLTQQDTNVVSATWTDLGITTINGTANQIATTTVGNTTTVAFTNDVTMPNNLIVSGNLTINGTATYVNTQSISAKDPLFEVANDNNTTDAVDIGYYGRYYDTPQTRVEFTGLFRDASDAGKFKFFTGLVDEPTNVVNTTGTGYTVGTLVANFEGNLAGTANAANALSTARTIAASGDATWSVSFDGSANVSSALTLANTGVTATTYGTSTAVPTIAIDSKGRITSASNTNITFPVTTVNGFAGTVVLTTSDVAEGTNQYFTTARAQAAITGGASSVVTANLTASRVLVSDGTGKIAASASITTTDLGYLSGVTSAIQTQLDSKLNLSGGTLTGGLSGTTGSFSGILTTPEVKAATSAGLSINANSGTQVANFGAGGGANITLYGGLTGTSATFSSTVGITGALSGTTANFLTTTASRYLQIRDAGTSTPSLRSVNDTIAQLRAIAIEANTISLRTGASSGLTVTEALGISATGAATFSNSFTTSDTAAIFLSPSLSANNTTFLQLGKNIADTYNSGEMSFKFVASGSSSNMVSLGFYGAGNKLNVLGNGNVGIGTSSPFAIAATNLSVDGASSAIQLGVSGVRNAQLYADGAEVRLYAVTNVPLRFGTNDTERLRITSGGFTKASNNGSYLGATGSWHEFTSNNATNFVLAAYQTSLSFDNAILYIRSTRSTVANNYYAIQYYHEGAGAYKFQVADSGNVTNTNNSYGAISDIKLKENITDATPKLDDLLKVKVKNFNFIGSEEKQLGVIAQELEEIFPSMIDESEDFEEVEVEGEDGEITKEKKSLGTITKSVKYSVFVPMLIKAIQELEARVKELEAK